MMGRIRRTALCETYSQPPSWPVVRDPEFLTMPAQCYDCNKQDVSSSVQRFQPPRKLGPSDRRRPSRPLPKPSRPVFIYDEHSSILYTMESRNPSKVEPVDPFQEPSPTCLLLGCLLSTTRLLPGDHLPTSSVFSSSSPDARAPKRKPPFTAALSTNHGENNPTNPRF